MIEYDLKDDFERELDTLTDLRARFECARIDAGACQTRSDWDHYHKMQDAFHDARDAFLAKWILPKPARAVPFIVQPNDAHAGTLPPLTHIGPIPSGTFREVRWASPEESST